jgi:hypothetical protein
VRKRSKNLKSRRLKSLSGKTGRSPLNPPRQDLRFGLVVARRRVVLEKLRVLFLELSSPEEGLFYATGV